MIAIDTGSQRHVLARHATQARRAVCSLGHTGQKGAGVRLRTDSWSGEDQEKEQRKVVCGEAPLTRSIAMQCSFLQL